MDEEITKADSRLQTAFLQIGYFLSPVGGVIDGTKVEDRGRRYLFAWHRNPHHLLFYIRMPALQARSTLWQTAMSQHGVAVKQNPGRETLITLYSDEDAAKPPY